MYILSNICREAGQLWGRGRLRLQQTRDSQEADFFIRFCQFSECLPTETRNLTDSFDLTGFTMETESGPYWFILFVSIIINLSFLSMNHLNACRNSWGVSQHWAGACRWGHCGKTCLFGNSTFKDAAQTGGHNIFHQIMLKYSCEGASSSVWACAQSSPPQFSRLCHESFLSWVDKGWRFTSFWWRFQPFVIGHRKVRPKNEIKLFLKLLPCVLLIMFQEKKDIKEIWKEVCFRLFTNMVL